MSTILKKQKIFDLDHVESSGSSSSSSQADPSSSLSTPDTSPFIARKQPLEQQQQNSELFNKMFDIAFNKNKGTTSVIESNNKKDSSIIMKEYRDLNTIVPVSL